MVEFQVWARFLLEIYCWTQGLPLKVVYFPSENRLKKSKFPFVSSYPLEIASWLMLGVECRLLSALAPTASPSAEPCRPCVRYHNFCEFIRVPALLCLEGLYSFLSSIPSHTLILFPTLLQISLSPEQRNLMVTSHLCWIISRSLILHIIFGYGSLYLFPHAQKEASLIIDEHGINLWI